MIGCIFWFSDLWDSIGSGEPMSRVFRCWAPFQISPIAVPASHSYPIKLPPPAHQTHTHLSLLASLISPTSTKMTPKQFHVTPVRRTLLSGPSSTRIPTRTTAGSAPAFLERLKGRPGHTPVAKLRGETTVLLPDTDTADCRPKSRRIWSSKLCC